MPKNNENVRNQQTKKNKSNRGRNTRSTVTSTNKGRKTQGKGEKPSRSQNRPPEAKATKNEEILRRPKLLAKHLQELFNLGKVKLRNDDFFIESITGVRTNVYSYYQFDSIRLLRTITNVTRKIKGLTPLKSDDEMGRDFVLTQTAPVLNHRILSSVAARADSFFSEFDYEEVLRLVKSSSRKKTITQGSSRPNNLAPVYYNDQRNTDLLVGMSAGEKIFEPDFDPSNTFVPIAGGVMIGVPKNEKTNRAITIAPAEIVDEQDVVSAALRDYTTIRSRTSNHITQFDDQSVQWNLLIEDYCTIDLSSASDRVYRRVIQAIMPEFYEKFEHLFPKDVFLPNGNITKLTCVGTQGFPLTFTLMSILIGLIVKTVKLSVYPSSNYGDDIIVHKDDFEEVYTSLEALGLVVNRSKTHRSSDGFLESCGMDVMFTPNGPRNITPVYLRGSQDIHFVQFFHQMCQNEMIEPQSAMQIMDKLNVEYFAFKHDFQITEFHFPHGDITNVAPLKEFNYSTSQYEVNVPCMVADIDSIRGLSKKDSEPVLELLRINALLKDPDIHEKRVVGSDPVAKPYKLYDAQKLKLYSLYIALNNADNHELVSYVILAKEHKVPLVSIFYYAFITMELRKYKYSTRTVEFSSYESKNFDLQELISDVLNIVHDVKYPIYNYRPRKSTKRILHPQSNLHLVRDV